MATLLRDDFIQAYDRELPAVVKCFTDDFDACIAHLRFPLRHRKGSARRMKVSSGIWRQAAIGWAWARVTPTEAWGTRLQAPPRR
jgi:hypothetical protein